MRRLYHFLFLGTLFLSCAEFVDSDISQVEGDPFYVTLDEAESVSGKINFPKFSENGRSIVGEFAAKKVSSILPIKDGNRNSMYVVEFEGGGFIILSADTRHHPIMAYSIDNSFGPSSLSNDGISQWVSKSKLRVEDYRVNRREQSDYAKEKWKKLWESGLRLGEVTSTNGRQGDPDDGDPGGGSSGGGCSGWIHYQVNPIFSLSEAFHWGQKDDYNNGLASDGIYCLNTTGTRFIGFPVGCVPVAFGMIMSYWDHPKGAPWYFDFSKMDGAESGTQYLLMRLGNHFGTSYACDGSSTFTPGVMSKFAQLGYSGTRADFSVSKVRSEIRAGRPVILEGFSTSVNSHTWISDGYQYDLNCSSGTTYNSKLYMNWGWYERGNGWYDFNDWRPVVDGKVYKNYNVKHKMFYGLKPN